MFRMKTINQFDPNCRFDNNLFLKKKFFSNSGKIMPMVMKQLEFDKLKDSIAFTAMAKGSVLKLLAGNIVRYCRIVLPFNILEYRWFIRYGDRNLKEFKNAEAEYGAKYDNRHQKLLTNFVEKIIRHIFEYVISFYL